MLNIIDDKNILFDGDDKLFKSYVADIEFYFEYGVGKSTQWVMENTNSKVIAIDSDQIWINNVSHTNYDYDRLNIIWADLGNLTDWGRPIGYKKRQNFSYYINAIWSFQKKADVILIDGRFRVACFLQSLLNSKIGSFIIFDDYNNRPCYHIVEEVLPLFEKCGRQSVFKVTDNYNKKLAKNLLKKFIYVFD